jgi:uncharacterized alpha-E superfamily protein
LSSLVQRFAENVYWLGRYLERAENIARILHVNETYARDNPSGPDWHHILELYSDADRFFETNEEASERAVLDFYIRNASNPSSIAFAVAGARENARTVRHMISTEMWTQINLFHNTVKDLTRRPIPITQLSRVATTLITGLQTFSGVAEGTFQRSEAWCFYQLGVFIERADQTTRLLDMSYDRLSMSQRDALASVQWSALLRSASGYYAFRARYPAASSPADIASFLLYDDEFPRAVTRCVQKLTERLADLERRHGLPRSDELEAARRSLEFSLETGPGRELTAERLHELLDQTQISIAALSNTIGRCYFGYAQVA